MQGCLFRKQSQEADVKDTGEKRGKKKSLYTDTLPSLSPAQVTDAQEPPEMSRRTLWPEDEREQHLSISLRSPFSKNVLHIVHTWAPYGLPTSMTNVEVATRST